MLRLCPHINDDDRTKIWAKWQDKLATHRQLLKKYKKGSPTADKEKYDELSKTYSKSLDKAFAALRVKYNTECGRFTHAQHDLEDRAAAISDQLATHVSLDVFRTASAAVDEAIRLYNVANEEAPDDTPTPALAKPSAVALVSGQKPPLNETAAPSCTTMVQTPTQQQSAQHPGSSAAPAPNQIRSSDQLMYPRPHQPDPAMFRPRPSSVPYGYGSDAQAAAVVLRANAQVPQHAAPSSGNRPPSISIMYLRTPSRCYSNDTSPSWLSAKPSTPQQGISSINMCNTPPVQVPENRLDVALL